MNSRPTQSVNATFFLCQSYSSDATRTGQAGQSSSSAAATVYRFVERPVSPRTAS